MPPGLRRLYALSLRLYPAGFRAQFGDEMAQVFAARLADAAAHGWRNVGGLCARELAGMVLQAAREQVDALRWKPARVAQMSGGPQVMGAPARRLNLPMGLLIGVGVAAVGLVGLPRAIEFVWAGMEETPQVNQAALADVNGDGYLDAVLAAGHGNMPFPTYVLYNDGAGRLGATTQDLGTWPGFAVALGDLDSDGQLEALLDTSGGGLARLGVGGLSRSVDWLNAPGPTGVMRLQPLVADLNADGRLDVFAAGCCGREGGAQTADMDPNQPPQPPYSQVWVQGPRGGLLPGQRVGELGSRAAALADLNGDGSLDVFLANGRTLHADGQEEPKTPNTVWFNDGEAHFSDSGQRLGQTDSTAVALGDLNGDGAADAVVGNNGPSEVWLNAGSGVFTDSGQRLGSGLTEAVFLADLEGDGDLDLVTASATEARIWLNDGRGRFELGRQHWRFATDAAVAVGDLNGDGAPDLLIAGPNQAQVWRNDGTGRLDAGPVLRYP